MLFVYGFDEISTSGRKALTFLSIIAGAFTGVAIVPRAGITSISIALVDASGTILWYSIKGSEGGFDLRDPESASRLLRGILSGFPNLGE
jgi:fructose-specific phosphotransferase system IIC component